MPTCLLAYLLTYLLYLLTHLTDLQVSLQLPLFRAAGALVLSRFCWAGCLHVWNRTRINYEFMLDFDGRSMDSSAVAAASGAVRSCTFLLLCLQLFTKARLGTHMHVRECI